MTENGLRKNEFEGEGTDKEEELIEDTGEEVKVIEEEVKVIEEEVKVIEEEEVKVIEEEVEIIEEEVEVIGEGGEVKDAEEEEENVIEEEKVIEEEQEVRVIEEEEVKVIEEEVEDVEEKVKEKDEEEQEKEDNGHAIEEISYKHASEEILDKEHAVEDILDKKTEEGQVFYLVKWEGFPSSGNTWEPLENLDGCEETMRKFEEIRAKKLADKYGGKTISSNMIKNKPASRHKEYMLDSILGLTKVGNEKYFLISLKDHAQTTFVRASLANKMFPDEVIGFYMKHMQWKRFP